MSFQWIIDNAESISMERKQVVASTVSRSGVVRAVGRGGQVWRFEVKLPDGIAWTNIRRDITLSENLGELSSGNIKLNNAGHSWLSGYTGNATVLTSWAATIVKGATSLTLTSNPTITSGLKFRAGDFIQLGTTGKVYTVAADVAFNSNTVALHRPILEASATNVAIQVGPNAQWTVRCVDFPTWTLFARDQVSWSGPFVFYEVI
jgi:hypothetical protein